MTTSETPMSPLSVSPLAVAFGTTWPTVEQAPFPRVVADLDGNGWPWWAARAVTGDVAWLATPQLPAGLTWATEADPINTPEYVVLNKATITELLYSSALAPGTHSRTELAQTVEGRLYAFRCRVEQHPEHDEPHRLADCRTWARELTGGAV